MKELLELKANKKLLQQKLAVETNQVVTLKDLSNIANERRTFTNRNDLKTSIDQLRIKYSETFMFNY